MADQKTTRVWLTKALGGDRLAVQKLILLHHGRLLALARKKIPAELRAKIDPDDILQQVYTDAMQRIADLDNRGKDAFFAWLSRILDSRLTDALRFFHAQARDVAREAPPCRRPSMFEALVERAALDSVTPSRIALRKETDALLHAALAGLSEDHRRVLELRFLQGLSLVQAAEQMDRTPAAAAMLSARALRSLRAALRDLSVS
jgi:RNA polymerase sigma-70 factor (ECF subfamily)